MSNDLNFICLLFHATRTGDPWATNVHSVSFDMSSLTVKPAVVILGCTKLTLLISSLIILASVSQLRQESKVI